MPNNENIQGSYAELFISHKSGMELVVASVYVAISCAVFIFLGFDKYLGEIISSVTYIPECISPVLIMLVLVVVLSIFNSVLFFRRYRRYKPTKNDIKCLVSSIFEVKKMTDLRTGDSVYRRANLYITCFLGGLFLLNIPIVIEAVNSGIEYYQECMLTNEMVKIRYGLASFYYVFLVMLLPAYVWMAIRMWFSRFRVSVD